MTLGSYCRPSRTLYPPPPQLHHHTRQSGTSNDIPCLCSGNHSNPNLPRSLHTDLFFTTFVAKPHTLGTQSPSTLIASRYFSAVSLRYFHSTAAPSVDPKHSSVPSAQALFLSAAETAAKNAISYTQTPFSLPARLPLEAARFIRPRADNG